MKLPKSPPDIHSGFAKHLNFQNDPTRFARFMGFAASIGTHGDYLHYDKIRFKPLPENLPEGMGLEEYWMAIKFSRNVSRKKLPFTDKHGNLFSFTSPDSLLADLRHIDIKACGTITTGQDAFAQSDGEKYLTRSVLEEPFSSSVLEGAATTRLKAQALIERGETPLNRDDRMVLNNYKAMMFIKEYKHEELTPAIILECHRIITEGTLDRPEMAGHLRDNNDVVVGDMFGEVFHVPPDFNELEARLQKLCDFANTEEGEGGPYVHPISKAVILHFMLAYDHPFVDGNGRTARALFYWAALKSDYWMIEYISISKVIKDSPAKYGMAFLHTETDENDLTYFLLHQLDVIKMAMLELGVYLDRQKVKYKAVENLLSDSVLNARQKYLLTELIRKRVTSITISDHQEQHGVAYLTARKDLDDLEKGAWLFRTVVGRKHIYEGGKALIELQG